MARILVTGSEGLVGTAARAWLERQGHQVVGFDVALPSGHRDHGDVLDFASLATRINGVAGILHLAAVSRVAHGEADPDRCWAVNVTGTANVIEAAAVADHRPWVIVASSREVYGEPEHLPVREDDPVRPCNIYGRSKAECEATALAGHDRGVATAVVRLANVYGSLQDHPDRVIPAFCRAAARGEAMRIEGPDSTFDFTHVADVVVALERLIVRMADVGSSPPVLQLVSGEPTTLRDLATMARAAGGNRSEIRTVPNKPYNVTRFVGDPARAERVLGWRTTIPIEEGVRMLVREFAAGDPTKGAAAEPAASAVSGRAGPPSRGGAHRTF